MSSSLDQSRCVGKASAAISASMLLCVMMAASAPEGRTISSLLELEVSRLTVIENASMTQWRDSETGGKATKRVETLRYQLRSIEYLLTVWAVG